MGKYFSHYLDIGWSVRIRNLIMTGLTGKNEAGNILILCQGKRLTPPDGGIWKEFDRRGHKRKKAAEYLYRLWGILYYQIFTKNYISSPTLWSVQNGSYAMLLEHMSCPLTFVVLSNLTLPITDTRSCKYGTTPIPLSRGSNVALQIRFFNSLDRYIEMLPNTHAFINMKCPRGRISLTCSELPPRNLLHPHPSGRASPTEFVWRILSPGRR